MNLDTRARMRLEAFGELVRHWNRTHNLVSRRDADRLETRHIADSLTLVPWVEGARLADVGSGAGFPGIPLAIAGPHWWVALVERSERKARFLRQALIELDIENAEVVLEDARRFDPREPFDTVTVRAVAKPAEAWEIVRHLLRPKGCALLQSSASLAALPFPGGRVRCAGPAPADAGEPQRHITKVQRLDETCMS